MTWQWGIIYNGGMNDDAIAPRPLDSNAELAERFLYTHFNDSWPRRDIPGASSYAIDPDHLAALADHIQDFIANVISSILDAGSERDAVNESDELSAAIHDELRGWTLTN